MKSRSKSRFADMQEARSAFARAVAPWLYPAAESRSAIRRACADLAEANHHRADSEGRRAESGEEAAPPCEDPRSLRFSGGMSWFATPDYSQFLGPIQPPTG